jgi:hypothetical protein
VLKLCALIGQPFPLFLMHFLPLFALLLRRCLFSLAKVVCCQVKSTKFLIMRPLFISTTTGYEGYPCCLLPCARCSFYSTCEQLSASFEAGIYAGSILLVEVRMFCTTLPFDKRPNVGQSSLLVSFTGTHWGLCSLIHSSSFQGFLVPHLRKSALISCCSFVLNEGLMNMEGIIRSWWASLDPGSHSPGRTHRLQENLRLIESFRSTS